MYDFLFARSYGYENALVRLQSAPLISGLADLGFRTQLLYITANDPVQQISEHKYFIYHYDDNLAVRLLVDIKKVYNNFSICLASDIYDIDRYVLLDEVSNLFVVPTEMHKKILQSAVRKPVCVVPECIDPIAYPPESWVPDSIQYLEPRKILWFGYPESFLKSFKYLMSPVSHAVPTSDLLVITGNRKVIDEVEHRDFEWDSFYARTSDVRYSLLSHFSYDNQVNTWIKSPNKLVTSVVRGWIPFCSATPAYTELLTRYDLSGLLFTKPDELRDLLLRREDIALGHSNKLKALALNLERELSFVEVSKKLLSFIPH